MIRFLLRLYPAAWRRRYGDELAELVADTGLSPRAAVDVARAAVLERQRELDAALTGGMTVTLGPAWRHPTSWALAAALLMAPTVPFVVISGLAYNLGLTGLASLRQSGLDWVGSLPRIADLVLLLVPVLAAVVALVPLVRVGLVRTEGERQLTVSVRLRWLNLLVGLIGLGVSGALIWNVFAESVLGVG